MGCFLRYPALVGLPGLSRVPMDEGAEVMQAPCHRLLMQSVGFVGEMGRLDSQTSCRRSRNISSCAVLTQRALERRGVCTS